MSIFTVFRRSAAAAIAQARLEAAFEACWVNGRPLSLAHDLVKALWVGEPDKMEGRGNPRPHKEVVALAALAVGVDVYSQDPSMLNAMMYALGSQLQHIRANAQTLPLHHFDAQLIQSAYSTFRAQEKAWEASGEAAVIDKLMAGGPVI